MSFADALRGRVLAVYYAPPLEVHDARLPDLVADDVPIERVAGGLWLTEGPVWRDGCLLFSDIPNKRIVRWRRLPEGPELTTYARGMSNGLTLDRPASPPRPTPFDSYPPTAGRPPNR